MIAFALAVVVTLGLFGIAFVNSGSHERIAYILYWQGYSLESLMPAPNIGTLEHPIYEATPAHMVAFFAGIPIGIVIYFAVAFFVLSFVARHRAPSP